MKVIHHLTSVRLIAIVLAVLVLGELAGWALTQHFDLRFPAVGIGAVTVGLTVGIVAWLYDGRDD